LGIVHIDSHVVQVGCHGMLFYRWDDVKQHIP
jgi:hypothetical protein